MFNGGAWFSFFTDNVRTAFQGLSWKRNADISRREKFTSCLSTSVFGTSTSHNVAEPEDGPCLSNFKSSMMGGGVDNPLGPKNGEEEDDNRDTLQNETSYRNPNVTGVSSGGVQTYGQDRLIWYACCVIFVVPVKFWKWKWKDYGKLKRVIFRWTVFVQTEIRMKVRSLFDGIPWIYIKLLCPNTVLLMCWRLTVLLFSSSVLKLGL